MPLLAYLLASFVHAQDLVPNPGFEEVLQCPDWQSQLDRTAYWFDPSDGGTPDYFHACGADWYSVPNSTVGFQEAVDGDAYVGIFLWFANVLFDWREYIEVAIAEPLVQGRCYRFRMHANLADFSGRTTDALGVRFYTDSVLLPDPHPPGDAPHISLTEGTFLDRDSWSILEGEYIAVGGERWLMIGNYLWDAQTSTQLLTGGPPNTGDFAHCLVDSVSLTPCEPSNTAIGERSSPLVEGSNIFADQIVVRVPGTPGASFSIIDMNGRKVVSGSAKDAVVGTTTWPTGVYVLEVLGAGHARRCRLLKD